jgi:acyl carrier protein/phospholipid N-methyltransferase
VVEPVARSDRPVRILEIGAGTGSTTASVLPALPPDRALYYFTDVSDLFLSRAAEKFGSAYPFVRYGLLNIEQAPQAQGYPLHSFDVILAANVLHATPNLDQTLQHVRSLLASDGLFVLFETTTHQSWFDMTTGLIEGWQRFDDELRHAQRNPLLSPAQWEAALRAEGFEAVMAFPQPGSPAEVLGQHVILAKAPSVDASENGEFPIAVFEQTGDDGQSYTASVPEQNASVGELIHQLCEALPAERVEVLVDFVREHVARVLRLDPSDPLDRRSRLMDLGVDSLMAVELRNRLSKGLGLQRSLPATLIFDYPTVEAIANYLATEALTFEPETEAAPSARAEREPTEATADIEQLSDAEVEALLLEKLKAMAR